MGAGEAAGGALLTGAAGWLFVVFAVLALGTAIAVVAAKNPVHSALFLLASFLLVACIFILEEAEFVGAVQILVYAGGIMVLFLFVIMLVHQRTSAGAAAFQHQWDVALLFLPVFLIPFLYILGTEKFADIARNPDAFRAVSGRVVGKHGGRLLAAVPGLPAALRGRVGVPSRRDDRRRRARQALGGEGGLSEGDADDQPRPRSSAPA